MLLIALGDGGAGGDPENRASDLGTILGKMLRIDVGGTPLGGGLAYAIPADNPYAGRTDARPEILHSGLRNPFRSSIDPATGNLWIGDVGQNAWEEVDVAPAGARGLDFGWRRWEGRHCFDPATGCDPEGVTMPVAEYGHGAGCSVIGGVVYRGQALPALRGAYLFSDYCSGTLWAIDAGVDAAQSPVTLLETGSAISSISTGEDGRGLPHGPVAGPRAAAGRRRLSRTRQPSPPGRASPLGGPSDQADGQELPLRGHGDGHLDAARQHRGRGIRRSGHRQAGLAPRSR